MVWSNLPDTSLKPYGKSTKGRVIFRFRFTKCRVTPEPDRYAMVIRGFEVSRIIQSLCTLVHFKLIDMEPTSNWLLSREQGNIVKTNELILII